MTIIVTNRTGMLDHIKSLLGMEQYQEKITKIDKNIAAAALMVHVIAVDGVVTPDEEKKLNEVLNEHYTLSTSDTEELTLAARAAQNEAVDLFSFTRILKRDLDFQERLALIEDLWEMVYADGKLHEFEDNVVWRVAELIGISSKDRMALKQRVLTRGN